MKISKNNYEVFFIDYYDGNLTAEQVAELFLFLESHPDLKAEFENFSMIKIDAPELEFPGRDALKRGVISRDNINEKLVASLEGDLSAEEEEALRGFIMENPEFKHDETLYKATVSEPDYSIIYPDKKSLKQPIPFFVAYRNVYRAGIAAILLLTVIAGAVTLYNRVIEQPSLQVAQEIQQPVQKVEQDQNQVQGDLQKSRANYPDVQPETQSKTFNKPATVITGTFTADAHREGIRDSEPVNTGNNLAEIQLAATVPAGNINRENLSMEPAKNTTHVNAEPAYATNSQPAGGEKYMTVWEALRETSEKNLRKAMGREEDEVLAYADEAVSQDIRLIDVVSKGVEKISNEKVKLESSYDPDKQGKRFSFSVGKFKIEKN